jgi:hypothetical protein
MIVVATCVENRTDLVAACGVDSGMPKSCAWQNTGAT